MNKFKKIILSLVVIIATFSPSNAKADFYNFYVDKQYIGKEEGTVRQPFTTIQKAIQRAGENDWRERKIYVKNGSYAEELILQKGVALFGEDKNNTFILGAGASPVILENDNTLENLTISGGIFAVTAKGGAVIRQCVIKDALKVGINALESAFSLRVENSEITNNGKGIYVEKGRSIAINKNHIHDNQGEGLDIRGDITGAITGNEITSNGEGGVEITAGGTNIQISNNKISQNKSSGVVNQFYPDNKTGEIKIFDNTIEENSEYGIYCGSPSGGDKPSNYWEDTLNIGENKFKHNKKRPTSGSCDGKEEKRKLSIEEDSAIATLDRLTNEKDRLYPLASKLAEELKNESRVKIFFLGPNIKKISELSQNAENFKTILARLGELESKIKAEEELENINSLKNDIQVFLSETSEIMEEKNKKFSLFGFIFNWFYHR